MLLFFSIHIFVKQYITKSKSCHKYLNTRVACLKIEILF